MIQRFSLSSEGAEGQSGPRSLSHSLAGDVRVPSWKLRQVISGQCAGGARRTESVVKRDRWPRDVRAHSKAP